MGVVILMNGGPGTVWGPRALAAFEEFARARPRDDGPGVRGAARGRAAASGLALGGQGGLPSGLTEPVSRPGS